MKKKIFRYKICVLIIAIIMCLGACSKSGKSDTTLTMVEENSDVIVKGTCGKK